MADVNAAIDFVLRQEDSTLSGICVKDPQDRGGLTRFGIASRWHPELMRSGFYIMNAVDALAIARGVYAKEYAQALSLGQIKLQTVANALLSFSVLNGCGAAIKGIQRALNRSDAWVAVQGDVALRVDGSLGRMTLRQVNACPNVHCPDLLSAYVATMREALQAIVAGDDSQRRWLNGWMNRCNAIAAQKA